MEPTINATLTEGRVASQLRIMAVPMVWGLAATMTLNIVDVFWIARLGSDPLAALSFTFPLIMVLTSLGIGLGAGTSSAVARAIGEGNSFMARRLATDAVSLTLLISVSVCLLGWLFIDELFRLLGATEALLPLIRGYMSIWLFSAPCLMLPMVCLAALRAMGLSSVQGYLMGGAALVNAALAPVLIFGWLGAPALGLDGAAWATLLTRGLMLLVAFYILLFRVGLLINPLIRWQQLKASWKAIVHVGIPAMAANVIVPLASAMVVAMVATYGTDAVAALGIAVRIEPLALIVFFALSGVVGPFFGQNLGAARYCRLWEALRVLTIFCILWGLLLAAVLFFSGAFLASFFTDHAGVVRVVVFYLSLVPLSYGAYGVIMSVNAAFNGMARPWPAMVLSAGRVLFVFLPLAFIGQYFWGLGGIFAATATSNIVIGLWGWLWLRRHIASQTASR